MPLELEQALWMYVASIGGEGMTFKRTSSHSATFFAYFNGRCPVECALTAPEHLDTKEQVNDSLYDAAVAILSPSGDLGH